MKNTKPQEVSFTQREIAETANNLVIRALRPKSLKAISPARLRQLREYAKALVEVCFEHVEEDAEGVRLLAPEELVMILACSTLFAQMQFVMGTAKMPAGDVAKELLE